MSVRRVAAALSAVTVLVGPAPAALSAPPLRLDVFVVFDDTSSIYGSRSTVYRLVAALARGADRQRGMAVALGVAAVRDLLAVPNPVHDPDPPYVYRAILAPTEDRAAFLKAVDALEMTGGGDEPEAQLIAVEQALLGHGMMPWVQPGNDAKFRAGARKAILLVTDSTYHEGEPFYPKRDDIARTLREYDAGFATAVIANRDTDTELALTDYRSIADTAGPLTRRAYDLNRDGVADVRRGAGVVCFVDTGTSYDAVAAMLYAELKPNRR